MEIKNILDYKKPSFWVMTSAIIILIVVAITLGTSENKKYSSSLDVNEFFEQLISIDTYNLDPVDDFEKLITIFSKYCNDRGLDILFKSRVALKHLDFFEENDIESYDNLNVELTKETSDETTIFHDYKISYNYIDQNNKVYEIVDYYTINIKDNKIDFIKFYNEKSSLK